MFEDRIAQLNAGAMDLAADIPVLSAQDKRTYTVPEIQDILSISRPTAYRLCNSGLFYVCRIGKQIRISAKSFDAWLEGTAQPVKSANQGK